MPLFLATYDIADDRARTRVARILTRFGERVQFSVFELRIETAELEDLCESLGGQLALEDEFDVYPIDERLRSGRLRWQKPVPEWSPVVEP